MAELLSSISTEDFITGVFLLIAGFVALLLMRDL